MNEFLNKIILDNTIRSYAIVFGVMLFMYILKKIISRYLAGLVYRLVRRIWKDVDKQSFSGMVAQPLGLFLLILVSIISLYKLKFPSVLDVAVYKYTTKGIIHTTGTIILILSFAWLVMRFIDFMASLLEQKANMTAGHSDNQLIVFFKDFFKIITAIIAILMVFKLGFGISIGNFVTGLSIVTAAIALATRESLENLIASFIIFFDKPYSIGDLVKVQQVTGTVEKIGLRSTKIRTDQKTYITVPNKMMVDSIVDNLSLRTQRKAEIRLEAAVKVPVETLQKFMDAVKTKMDHLQIEESTVFLNDIKPNSFLIHVDFFTAPISFNEFNELKQGKSLEILQLMEEMNIELAGAGTEVKITGIPKQ